MAASAYFSFPEAAAVAAEEGRLVNVDFAYADLERQYAKQHAVYHKIQRVSSWAASLSSLAQTDASSSSNDFSDIQTIATTHSSNGQSYLWQPTAVHNLRPNGIIIQAGAVEARLNIADRESFFNWMSFWHPREVEWMADMSPAQEALRWHCLVDEWKQDCTKYREVNMHNVDNEQDKKFFDGIYAVREPKPKSWWSSWF